MTPNPKLNLKACVYIYIYIYVYSSFLVLFHYQLTESQSFGPPSRVRTAEGLLPGCIPRIPPIMENQLGKDMEHEMEARS